MGIKKGIGWSIAGILALEYAAHKINQPGLGQLVDDIVHSGSIGGGIDTMFRYMFDYYGLYDKFAAIGTAGQAMMYGGLSNIIYNIFKKPEKPEEQKPEK